MVSGWLVPVAQIRGGERCQTYGDELCIFVTIWEGTIEDHRFVEVFVSEDTELLCVRTS